MSLLARLGHLVYLSGCLLCHEIAGVVAVISVGWPCIETVDLVALRVEGGWPDVGNLNDSTYGLLDLR